MRVESSQKEGGGLVRLAHVPVTVSFPRAQYPKPLFLRPPAFGRKLERGRLCVTPSLPLSRKIPSPFSKEC